MPDLYKLRNRTKNLIFYPSYINNNSLENVPDLINGMPSVKDFLVSLDSNLSNKKNMFVNKVMSLILPICRVPVEVGRFLARHVFFSVILSMRGAKFQFLLRWSKLKYCRWLNKSCFLLAENGDAHIALKERAKELLLIFSLPDVAIARFPGSTLVLLLLLIGYH